MGSLLNVILAKQESSIERDAKKTKRKQGGKRYTLDYYEESKTAIAYGCYNYFISGYTTLICLLITKCWHLDAFNDYRIVYVRSKFRQQRRNKIKKTGSLAAY